MVELLNLTPMMKKQPSTTVSFFLLVGILFLVSCSGDNTATSTSVAESSVDPGSQAKAVLADENANTIVHVALNSPNHKTLVDALKAAELVDALANVGPFTVFAPTDEAFSKLPEGTLEELTKPENKEKLASILKYHVTTSALSEMMLQNGMTLGMANGGKATIKKEGDKILINEANILGSVQASNGMVYVIDKVLLPPQ